MKKNVFKIQSLICSATVLSGVLGMGSVSAGGAFSTMSHPEDSAHAPEETIEELQYNAPAPIISEKGYELPSPPFVDGAIRVISSVDQSGVESAAEWDFCLSRSAELLDKMNVMCASLLKGVFESNNMNCWSECSDGQLIEERIESAKRAYRNEDNRYDAFCVLRVLLRCMEKERDNLSRDTVFCELYNFINSVFEKFDAFRQSTIRISTIVLEMRHADKRTCTFLEKKVHDLSTFYFRYRLAGAPADER